MEKSMRIELKLTELVFKLVGVVSEWFWTKFLLLHETEKFLPPTKLLQKDFAVVYIVTKIPINLRYQFYQLHFLPSFLRHFCWKICTMFQGFKDNGFFVFLKETKLGTPNFFQLLSFGLN